MKNYKQLYKEIIYLGGGILLLVIYLFNAQQPDLKFIMHSIFSGLAAYFFMNKNRNIKKFYSQRKSILRYYKKDYNLKYFVNESVILDFFKYKEGALFAIYFISFLFITILVTRAIGNILYEYQILLSVPYSLSKATSIPMDALGIETSVTTKQIVEKYDKVTRILNYIFHGAIPERKFIMETIWFTLYTSILGVFIVSRFRFFKSIKYLNRAVETYLD